MEEITVTLDHVDLEHESRREDDVVDRPADDGEEPPPELPQVEETEEEKSDTTGDEDKEEEGESEIIRSHSQEDLDQPFHDAVPNQPQSLFQTPSLSPSRSPEDVDPPPPTIPAAAAPMVLTPPAQEPSRGVPGPQYELERSPFLTDDEVEGEESEPDHDQE
jgi:hypothetical protein